MLSICLYCVTAQIAFTLLHAGCLPEKSAWLCCVNLLPDFLSGLLFWSVIILFSGKAD
jgi:hypothetical protein